MVEEDEDKEIAISAFGKDITSRVDKQYDRIEACYEKSVKQLKKKKTKQDISL